MSWLRVTILGNNHNYNVPVELTSGGEKCFYVFISYLEDTPFQN